MINLNISFSPRHCLNGLSNLAWSYSLLASIRLCLSWWPWPDFKVTGTPEKKVKLQLRFLGKFWSALVLLLQAWTRPCAHTLYDFRVFGVVSKGDNFCVSGLCKKTYVGSLSETILSERFSVYLKELIDTCAKALMLAFSRILLSPWYDLRGWLGR